MNNHNPMQFFQKWFFDAESLYNEQEPNAMSLATVGEDGYPKTRMVLLKKYTWEGFIFYTNYESEKGKAISHNSSVCLLFNWLKSERKILVQGTATKVSSDEATNYFHARPRGSQLGAWASQQGQIIASRAVLEKRFIHFEKEFEGKEIPKPDHWGGYLVKPSRFCFSENKKDGFYEEKIYQIEQDYTWSKNIITYLKTV